MIYCSIVFIKNSLYFKIIINQVSNYYFILYRFHREEILSNLLNGINATSSSTTVKRVPSHVAHQLADEIGKHFLSTIRVRKSLMPCPFVTEFATFSLPYGKLIKYIKITIY